jgi:hypothetical protein
MPNSHLNSGRTRRAARPDDAATAPHSSIDPGLHPNSIVTRSAALAEPRHRDAMVAEAAYYLAERRAFDPGHELEDWFAAEQQIDAALAHGETPPLESSPTASAPQPAVPH